MDGLTESQKNSPALSVFAGGGEMGELMRRKDWSLSALGPVESWSQSLRTAVDICLSSTFPVCVMWGRELVQLYNDGYRLILGAKHPQSLGRPTQENWSEVWHKLRPLFEGVLQTGQPTYLENNLQLLNRNGYLEETYFTFSFNPIRDETGEVAGIFHPVMETTAQVISERRLRTLSDLGTRLGAAKTLEECGESAIATFRDSAADIPFALLYLRQDDVESLQLCGTTGWDKDWYTHPEIVNLTALEELGKWPFAQAIHTGQVEQVDRLASHFDGKSAKIGSELPDSALVLPLTQPGQDRLTGLLIAGISPHGPLDQDYRGFFELVARQVATAVANVRAYEEERDRAQALVELDRAKTAFFSNISHEFRTPLTLMLSPLEDILALGDDEPLADRRQLLEVIHRNGLRLLKLVNTLLDFSRIEAGRVQAVYKRTDLAKFTAELASVFRSAIERAGLTLIVDCSSDFSRYVEKDLTPQPPSLLVLGENSKPLSLQERGLERGFPDPVKNQDGSPLSEPVYVDRDIWEKIVLNLLSNAFKFTFSGQIAVKLRQVINHAQLTVQDTGVGIPEAELPRLFERFHRVSGTRSRSYEGSGIGLSLVQELVKLHGGTIEVSSQVDVGTTFTVAIPLGKAHLPSDRLWREAPQAIARNHKLPSTATAVNTFVEEALRWLPEEAGDSGSRGAGEQESKGAGENVHSNSPLHTRTPAPLPTSSARILLVDDNADMRDYVQRLLVARSQVKAAENGAVALAIMQNWMPDLILSDVMMPELDGFGLLQAIRANPHTQGIPFILLSARAGVEAAIEGLEAGADDYLIKPFSGRELMARVNINLQMARLRQERSANRLKDEFLATLTHELNAPLAAILAWVRLLQTKTFDQTATLHALETIERNASNQAKLIEDLLDMSSILSGKRCLNPQPVDLVSIINDVLNTLYRKAQEKAIALSYGIEHFGLDSSRRSSPGRDVTCNVSTKFKTQNSKFIVTGEPKRLQQIVANLLSNAIKFTPEGGKIAIQLGVEKHQEEFSYARIQIEDTGCGIGADFLPYVFDRFRQEEVPSRHSPAGVGIGLAIARHLVELHGGTIEVASAGEGRGATFTVRLPLQIK